MVERPLCNNGLSAGRKSAEGKGIDTLQLHFFCASAVPSLCYRDSCTLSRRRVVAGICIPLRQAHGAHDRTRPVDPSDERVRVRSHARVCVRRRECAATALLGLRGMGASSNPLQGSTFPAPIAHPIARRVSAASFKLPSFPLSFSLSLFLSLFLSISLPSPFSAQPRGSPTATMEWGQDGVEESGRIDRSIAVVCPLPHTRVGKCKLNVIRCCN